MSDIVYVENELNGLEVVINDIEQEVTPEGVIFVRNGEAEIKAYADDIIKPGIDTYAEEQKSDIAKFMAQQTEAAKTELSVNVAAQQKPALDAYTEVKKAELDDYEQDKESALGDYASAIINAMTSLRDAAATSEANAADSASAAALSASSAADVIDGFDNYAAEKQSAFDTNATVQIQAANQVISEHKAVLVAEFDEYAAGKQAEVDASAAAAQASENNAKTSEEVCQDVLERLGTVIKIKGRVDAVDNLPASGNLNGDAYLVGSAGGDNFAEYFWFSDHWEFLGTTGTKLAWGNITGEISAQTDLQEAFALKADAAAVNASLDLKADASAVESSLALKANLDSPVFSGTPTVPTVAVSDNSQQVINSAWFNQKMVVVETLPESPDANVFYFCTNS